MARARKATRPKLISLKVLDVELRKYRHELIAPRLNFLLSDWNCVGDDLSGADEQDQERGYQPSRQSVVVDNRTLDARLRTMRGQGSILHLEKKSVRVT